MASSSGPGAPFKEPRRIELMIQIVGALATMRHHAIEKLGTSYACLWLADIEKLEDIVDDYLPNNCFGLVAILKVIIEYHGRIGQRWQQKRQNREFLDSRKMSGEFLDSPQSAEDACRDRDKACILTRCSRDICQPCLLYPIWMRDENMDDEFFVALRHFWSDGKVEEWYNAIYGDASGPEKLENLILLSLNAYVLYSKGYIAFEPLDRDPGGKWLTLRIWWLKRHEEERVDFSAIPQLPSDFHPSNHGVALHDVCNDHPLLSGDTIKLPTHDPENYPLPDTRILEMQWILNRVLALRGTAEPKDLEDDESDEVSDEGWI